MNMPPNGRLPPDQRPSLADYAAGGVADPWACRVCGCRMTNVVNSHQYGVGPRKRQRVCRHCGEPMTTVEVPIPPGHRVVVVPGEQP